MPERHVTCISHTFPCYAVSLAAVSVKSCYLPPTHQRSQYSRPYLHGGGLLKNLFWKDLEVFGRDLSWGSIPLFAWRAGGKPQRNLTVRIRTHHLHCRLS